MLKETRWRLIRDLQWLLASSSGIGHETSLTLARNGFLTYATMRGLHKGENIKSIAQKENLPLKTVQLDVTDDISVKNAIQSITAQSGKIDVLVNNAGYTVVGRLCYNPHSPH